MRHKHSWYEDAPPPTRPARPILVFTLDELDRVAQRDDFKDWLSDEYATGTLSAYATGARALVRYLRLSAEAFSSTS